MNIKHIIWDYNGTLLDDVELCVDVINSLLKPRNIPLITLNDYKELFEFPVKNYYAKLGFDFRKDSFETVGTEFIVNYDKQRDEIKLKTGAKKILKKISEAGIRQSVLSARKHEQLIEELEHFGIEKYFTNIVGLNDHYAEGKIENGKKLISEIKLSKEQIILIGDTVHDWEVAGAMEIKSLLLADGHHTKEKLEKCKVPVFDNLKEIEKYFLKNNLFSE